MLCFFVLLLTLFVSIAQLPQLTSKAHTLAVGPPSQQHKGDSHRQHADEDAREHAEDDHDDEVLGR